MDDMEEKQMRILLVPAALLLFVIISQVSQAIAFTAAEKTIMFGGGMLLVGAFIVLAFR